MTLEPTAIEGIALRICSTENIVESVRSVRQRLDKAANMAFLRDRTSLSHAPPKWEDAGVLNLQSQDRSTKEWLQESYFNKEANSRSSLAAPTKLVSKEEGKPRHTLGWPATILILPEKN